MWTYICSWQVCFPQDYKLSWWSRVKSCTMHAYVFQLILLLSPNQSRHSIHKLHKAAVSWIAIFAMLLLCMTNTYSKKLYTGNIVSSEYRSVLGTVRQIQTFHDRIFGSWIWSIGSDWDFKQSSGLANDRFWCTLILRTHALTDRYLIAISCQAQLATNASQQTASHLYSSYQSCTLPPCDFGSASNQNASY